MSTALDQRMISFGPGGLSGVRVSRPGRDDIWVEAQGFGTDRPATVTDITLARRRFSTDGDPRSLIDLYDSYIRKNSDLRSAVELRTAGLDSRPVIFSAPTTKGADGQTLPADPQAVAHASDLQAAWNRSPHDAVVSHLVYAGRSYGVAPVEIIWAATDRGILWTNMIPVSAKALQLATIESYPQFDPGTWLLRRDDATTPENAEPLIDGKWLVGSPNPTKAAGDRSLMSTSIFDAVFGQSVLGSWTLWLERYGLPFLHVKIQDLTDEKAYDTARQIIARAGDDHGVITGLLDEIEVNIVDGALPARNGVSDPHDRYLEKVLQRINRLWLGGTLLNSTGTSGSYNQGGVHENSFRAIVQTDARYVETTIQRDLVGPWAAMNNIPDEQVPRVELRLRIDTPGEVATLAQMLGQAGYDMDTEQLSETTGFVITKRETPQPGDSRPAESAAA